MNRPTLAQFQADPRIARLGICADDISTVAAIANAAQEDLILDPMTPDEGWWGGWVRMVFNVQSALGYAYIVTPFDIARVILLDVCNRPIRLRNGFYEYMEFGIGLKPEQCPRGCSPNTMQAFERDVVFTLNDFAATPQQLRVYISNAADLGKRIVLQGLDQNGLPVRGIDVTTQAGILGETVVMQLPFSTSLNTFSSIIGVQKDPTVGPVQVFMVDPVTGASLALTTLEPNEVTGQYRRYLLNGLKCSCCNTPGGTVQVSAQCKLDFVPVVSSNDYLTIQCIPAIFEQAQSRRYADMDSAAAPALEKKHHDKAIALLNGQLDLYLGKVNTAVRVSLWGSDKLRLQPR